MLISETDINFKLTQTSFRKYHCPSTSENGSIKVFASFFCVISSEFFPSIGYMYCLLFFTEEFWEVMKKTELHHKMPLNPDSDFLKLYFGKDKNRVVNYSEFSQFLHVSAPLNLKFMFELK